MIIFLAVFSLSFFVRGTWDLVMVFHSNMAWSQADMAATIFIVYFFTELLPILVIYLVHALTFHDHIKKKRLRNQQNETC